MKKAVKLAPDQAAEIAVQGIFAKADRDRAERFKRQGKLDAAKKAAARSDERLQSLKGKYSR